MTPSSRSTTLRVRNGDVMAGHPRHRRATGTHRFLIYARLDTTPVLADSSSTVKATEYLMGNHTIAEMMFRHDPAVMLHAPLRVWVFEDHSGVTGSLSTNSACSSRAGRRAGADAELGPTLNEPPGSAYEGRPGGQSPAALERISPGHSPSGPTRASVSCPRTWRSARTSSSTSLAATEEFVDR